MRYFLLITLLLFCLCIIAQNNWQAHLYPNSMSCMYENQDFIWFGSPSGILKIDKNNDINEILNTVNFDLSANNVTSINQDSNDNIWVTHYSYWDESQQAGGVTVINTDGSVDYYNQANSGIISNNIQDIEFDDDGNVWIALLGDTEGNNGGILKFTPETNQWESYNKDNSVLNANHVMDLAKDASGNIWAAVKSDLNLDNNHALGGGICKITPEEWTMYDDEILDPPADYSNPENWEVSKLTFDSEGKIWFGLNGKIASDLEAKGLYSFDGNSFVCHQTPNYDDLYLSNYWHVAVDTEDNIWVQSCAATVARFNQENQSWNIFNEDNSPVLGYTFLKNIFADSEGRVWVSKSNDKLIYFEDGSFHYYEYSADNNVQTYNDFYDIESYDGDVYFGTGYFDTDLARQNSLLFLEDNIWNTYSYNDFDNYIVNGISWDESGRLVLATGEEDYNSSQLTDNYGGVAIRDNNDWIIHNMNSTDYPFYASNAAVVDNYGNIWCANQLNGIAFYDQNEWSAYQTTNSPLYDNTMTDIEYNDETNEIWAASAVGLFKIQIDENGATDWDSFNPGNSDLSSGLIYDIHKDCNGVSWFGTDAGLVKWNGDELVSMNNLIGELIVLDITSDQYNRIWLATYQNGVVRFDGEEYQQWTISNSPLPKNWIDYIGCDRNDKIWLHPEQSGIYSFEYDDPTKIADKEETLANLKTRNYPNPFNPKTTINFTIPEDGIVQIGIYNVKGQKIKPILNKQLSSGNHSVIWNGTDENGKNVSSGIYFYKINYKNSTLTKKMMLIK